MEAGFLLEDWEVRPRRCTVQRLGTGPAQPARIEPRVMAVLLCLARHAGDVVTRDEFSAEVWGGRIVSDEALSRCISVLRQTFGDEAREPRFIRTVAKIGYALIPAPAPLDRATDAPPPVDAPSPVAAPPPVVAPPPVDAEPPVAAPSPPPPRGGLWARGGMVAALCIVGIAAAALVVHRQQSRASGDPPPPVTRLLVLPFDVSDAREFGRDVGVELANEITDALAHTQRLQISGRTSADALAAAHLGVVEAGRKLGVDAVLSGAVAERDSGLRVAVQLTSTSDGHVLWSRVYERRAADIFVVESSIASAVERELVGLLSADSLAGVSSLEPESRDLEAYRLYLRASHQVRLRGEDSLRLAIDLYSAALRRDPGYARAQAGLAWAYVLLPSYSSEDPVEMYALAEKTLVAAEGLSRGRALTAGTRAYLSFVRGRWLESETAFRTAIVADPNNPELRQMYSQLLGAVGRFDAALGQTRLALDIDPLAPVVVDRLGILYLWRGLDTEAARSAALARELGLDEVANPETTILLKLHQHEDADALDRLRRLQESLNRSTDWIGPAIQAYRHAEQRRAVVPLLDRLFEEGRITPRIYFGVMVLLEEPARALRGFAALPNHGGNDLEFLFSIDAAAVRRDPLFGEFVRKLGLVAYWDRYGWSPACRRDGARIACH
jgi:DNA-binding winged helix-turn-helix (wHTH) protein/TolB-like protein/Tfp pilus assembly protein PilF